MGNTYKTNSHSRYLLQFHVILVCKYRKKLLAADSISSDIKHLSEEICRRHAVTIRYMEIDRDHIHYLLETHPDINLSDFVRTLKSYTAYHIWEKYGAYLSHCFWKGHAFWNDGYFIASVGNVSEKILKNYIENQGKE